MTLPTCNYNIAHYYLMKTIIRVKMQNSLKYLKIKMKSMTFFFFFYFFALLAAYSDKVQTEICILELFIP